MVLVLLTGVIVIVGNIIGEALSEKIDYRMKSPEIVDVFDRSGTVGPGPAESGQVEAGKGGAS